ncbi:outer membrane protein assembly factor BamB family protein [Nonomuraea sp. NPDC004297]
MSAATGRVLRAFPLPRPYRFVEVDVRFVGESLAVRTDEPRGERITLYDPLTGAVRWSRLVPFAGAPILLPYTQSSVQARTGIVRASGDGLRGLDPATGRDTWTLPWPRACPERILLTAERPLLVEQCPDGSGVLYGVDTRTGRIAWRHAFPRTDGDILAPDVSSTGLIEVSHADVFTALDPDGRVIARLPGRFPTVAGPTAVRTGGLTLLVHSENGARVMTALRGAGGRVAWRTTLRPPRALGSSDGHLPSADFLTARHAVSHVPHDLEARSLEFVSLADGRRVSFPLAAGGPASVVAGSTARDVLMYEIHPDGGHVTAYTLRPGRGAGSPLAVPPERWPDACALADRAVPEGYTPVPAGEEHLGLRWPRANTCVLLPADDSKAQVKVAVGWVSATDADARRLAGSKLAADPGAERLGEGAYLSSAGDRDGRRTSGWAFGGRVLVHVEATGDPALTRRATRAVATRLHGP